MPSDVPSGWLSQTLGQVAAESRARFDPNGEGDALPYVGLEHIIPGAALVRDFGSSADVTSQKTLFRPGDVLFGKLRPYLRKVAAVDRDGVCSTDILAIRPKRGTDGGFLLNLLTREETIHWATGNSAGTKMPRTSWNALAEMEVVLPPLPEQRKIAAILSSVDEAIAATQAVIEQTRRVKEGLLQDLLTRGIGHTRFKQTEIGEIPEGWEVRKLYDVVKLSSGKSKPRGGLAPAPSEQTGIPVFGGNGITGYSDEMLLEDGTIVIGRVGEYCGNVLLTDGPAWITDNALYAKQLLLPVRIEFLALLLAHLDLGRLRKKGGQPLVTQGVIGAVVVAMPPDAEQEAIVVRIGAVDASVQVQIAEAHRLQRVKAGLLQDLLTGKVRVSA